MTSRNSRHEESGERWYHHLVSPSPGTLFGLVTAVGLITYPFLLFFVFEKGGADYKHYQFNTGLPTFLTANSIKKVHKPPQVDNLIVLQDITPNENDKRHMFCAAIYKKESDDFQALAGKRPEDGMTSYRFTRGLPSFRESQFTTDFSGWEDPRLLELTEDVTLAFLQHMGNPFAVMRWFRNLTFGPLNKLGIKMPGTGKVVYEATKNWSPFSVDGILHFVICPHPLVVVRCESADNVHWDVCEPQGEFPSGYLEDMQSFQRSLIYRGGSNFIPYPDGRSRIFFGLLHSRYPSDDSMQQGDRCGSIGSWEYLHVPIVYIILRAEDKWWPVWLGLVPNITGASEWPSNLSHLISDHIQDPVSITHIEDDGSVYATLNMGDEYGRCALGVYPHAVPARTDRQNWVLMASKAFQTFNMTKAYEDSVLSLKRMCAERYGHV